MPRSSGPIPDSPMIEDAYAGPKTIAEQRQEALNGFLQIGQFIALAFGQFADAGAIGLHGEPMVNEAVKLAENDTRIASGLDTLMQVGPYAGFITATIPFLAQILVNHKLLKPEQMANAGVVTPETLESKMKTELMRKAMDAMMEQKRLETEMQEMEDAIRASMNGEGPKDADISEQ
jgi:hypothetical protein